MLRQPTPVPGAQRTLHRVVTPLALASAALLAGCSLFSSAPSLEEAPQSSASTVVQPAQIVTATPASTDPAAATPVALGPLPEVSPTALTESAAPQAPAPQAVAVPPPQAATHVPKKTLPASALVPGFYINVGLFAVPSNGTRAYQKLEAGALPVFSDVVDSKKGPLTRVRVGPYPTRAKANAAAKKIHALKLDANVFRH